MDIILYNPIMNQPMQRKTTNHGTIVLALVLTFTAFFPLPGLAWKSEVTQAGPDPPEQGQFFTRRLKLSAAVGIASVTVGTAFYLGIDESTREPLIGGPNRLDRFFRNRLLDAGRSTNITDAYGSYITLAAGLDGIVLAEALATPGSMWRPAAYESTVFGIGFMTEVGLRVMVKTTVARRRPLVEFASPVDYAVLNGKDRNHQSFYSGHTSSAFYAAAYADQKVGDLLSRHGLSRFRPLSVVGTFGWASYVGYSRIQIDKHYFTDVAVGALVGTAWGIWHYRLHHDEHRKWSVFPAINGRRVGMMVSREY